MSRLKIVVLSVSIMTAARSPAAERPAFPVSGLVTTLFLIVDAGLRSGIAFALYKISKSDTCVPNPQNNTSDIHRQCDNVEGVLPKIVYGSLATIFGGVVVIPMLVAAIPRDNPFSFLRTERASLIWTFIAGGVILPSLTWDYYTSSEMIKANEQFPDLKGPSTTAIGYIGFVTASAAVVSFAWFFGKWVLPLLRGQGALPLEENQVEVPDSIHPSALPPEGRFSSGGIVIMQPPPPGVEGYEEEGVQRSFPPGLGSVAGLGRVVPTSNTRLVLAPDPLVPAAMSSRRSQQQSARASQSRMRSSSSGQGGLTLSVGGLPEGTVLHIPTHVVQVDNPLGGDPLTVEVVSVSAARGDSRRSDASAMVSHRDRATRSSSRRSTAAGNFQPHHSTRRGDSRVWASPPGSVVRNAFVDPGVSEIPFDQDDDAFSQVLIRTQNPVYGPELGSPFGSQ